MSVLILCVYKGSEQEGWRAGEREESSLFASGLKRDHDAGGEKHFSVALKECASAAL